MSPVEHMSGEMRSTIVKTKLIDFTKRIIIASRVSDRRTNLIITGTKLHYVYVKFVRR
jgi:hypothetical protein